MLVRTLFAALLLVLAPCLVQADAQPGRGPDRGPFSCDRERRCHLSGCNGEICASDSIFTPCVVLPVHACFSLAQCDCQGNHCGWRGNAEFHACLRAHADDRDAGPASGGPSWRILEDGRVVTTLSFEGHEIEIELLPDGSSFIAGTAFAGLSASIGTETGAGAATPPSP